MKTDLTDAFVHNLHQMYFIEKFLVKSLEKLSSEAMAKDLKADLQKHKKETMDHVKNIERVFDLAGIKKAEMKLESWIVMEKENISMLKMVSKEAKDFFILQAAAKAERLEITYYEALILSSKEVGLANEGAILSLLRENLIDEEKTLAKGMMSMKAQVSLWNRMVH